MIIHGTEHAPIRVFGVRYQTSKLVTSVGGPSEQHPWAALSHLCEHCAALQTHYMIRLCSTRHDTAEHYFLPTDLHYRITLKRRCTLSELICVARKAQAVKHHVA